jgi:chromosome segregation ATPase
MERAEQAVSGSQRAMQEMKRAQAAAELHVQTVEGAAAKAELAIKQVAELGRRFECSEQQRVQQTQAQAEAGSAAAAEKPVPPSKEELSAVQLKVQSIEQAVKQIKGTQAHLEHASSAQLAGLEAMQTGLEELTANFQATVSVMQSARADLNARIELTEAMLARQEVTPAPSRMHLPRTSSNVRDPAVDGKEVQELTHRLIACEQACTDTEAKMSQLQEAHRRLHRELQADSERTTKLEGPDLVNTAVEQISAKLTPLLASLQAARASDDPNPLRILSGLAADVSSATEQSLEGGHEAIYVVQHEGLRAIDDQVQALVKGTVAAGQDAHAASVWSDLVHTIDGLYSRLKHLEGNTVANSTSPPATGKEGHEARLTATEAQLESLADTIKTLAVSMASVQGEVQDMEGRMHIRSGKLRAHRSVDSADMQGRVSSQDIFPLAGDPGIDMFAAASGPSKSSNSYKDRQQAAVLTRIQMDVEEVQEQVRKLVYDVSKANDVQHTLLSHLEDEVMKLQQAQIQMNAQVQAQQAPASALQVQEPALTNEPPPAISHTSALDAVQARTRQLEEAMVLVQQKLASSLHTQQTESTPDGVHPGSRGMKDGHRQEEALPVAQAPAPASPPPAVPAAVLSVPSDLHSHLKQLWDQMGHMQAHVAELTERTVSATQTLANRVAGVEARQAATPVSHPKQTDGHGEEQAAKELIVEVEVPEIRKAPASNQIEEATAPKEPEAARDGPASTNSTVEALQAQINELLAQVAQLQQSHEELERSQDSKKPSADAQPQSQAVGKEHTIVSEELEAAVLRLTEKIGGLHVLEGRVVKLAAEMQQLTAAVTAIQETVGEGLAANKPHVHTDDSDREQWVFKIQELANKVAALEADAAAGRSSLRDVRSSQQPGRSKLSLTSTSPVPKQAHWEVAEEVHKLREDVFSKGPLGLVPREEMMRALSTLIESVKVRWCPGWGMYATCSLLELR